MFTRPLWYPRMASDDQIRLEKVAPFSIGTLRVEPSTRQFKTAASSQTLEPRVLQVLILLVAAEGRVVGRQELIDRCWAGRAVGEQAINRVIAILRKLAVDHGDAFAIHTVTKVGYRLAIAGTGSEAEAGPAAVGASSELARTPARDGSPAPLSDHAPVAAAPQSPSRRRLMVATGAAGVAAALGVGLFATRRAGRDDLPPEAQGFIDRGLDELDVALPDVQKQATAYFRRATELAPRSAKAWGALALGYAVGKDFNDPAAMRQTDIWTRSAAAQALELDSNNRDAQASLYLLQPSFRRWGPYEAGLRHLLRQMPDHPFLLDALVQCLGDVGRWRDAVALLTRYVELEPRRLQPKLALALANWHMGRLQEAESGFAELIELLPSDKGLLSIRLNFLVLTGQRDQAEGLFARFGDEDRGSLLMPAELAISASRAIAGDDRAGQAAVIKDLVALRARHQMAAVPAVAYLSVLGDVDAAYEVLRGYLFGGALPWDAPFRPRWPIQRDTAVLFGWPMRNLRADPRFGWVTRALRLEDYWQASGTVPDYRAN